MATTVLRPTRLATSTPGRRYDHIFFPIVCALMLVTVFVGFAPTYYLAGVFRAPLPSPIIHVHGALFSSWILLLIVQTSLVAGHRVDIHRRVGIVGFLLACAMIIVGVAAATDSLLRDAIADRDAQAFYLIPLSDMVIFAGLVAFAFRERRNAAAHKRLILIATNALLIAAVARWPWSLVHHRPATAGLVSDVFLLVLIAYDLWALRRIHQATLWAGLFLIVIQNIRYPLADTAAWHTVASWVQTTLR